MWVEPEVVNAGLPKVGEHIGAWLSVTFSHQVTVDIKMMLSCKSCKKTNLSPSNCGYRWIFIVYINLPCRSVFLSLSSDWNRSRRPWYHLEKSWKYFRTDSKILIMFAFKALYENQLFRLNQSIHTGDKTLLLSSLLVPFYQFSKQKSEVKNVHNSLWSLTLWNLITDAWYHPPLMAWSSHHFLYQFLWRRDW